MTRKQKKELRQHQTARQLMGIDQLTDHGLKTPNGELVFYCIQPDNLSVLPAEEVRERVLALGNLLRTTNEMILMALDSLESFQHNQLWYRQRGIYPRPTSASAAGYGPPQRHPVKLGVLSGVCHGIPTGQQDRK